MEKQHIIIVIFSAVICVKTMQTLEQTLEESCNWSRERIHVLCENGKVEETTKSVDDAFAIFSEFEEWYDENADDHEIFSLEWLGEDSDLK